MPRSKHKQTRNGVHPDALLVQEIITQRKAETKARAEHRRQQDMQRIQEMRSNTGVDPVELFPEELWEAILDKLSPVDKGNILRVHELFQNLLENTRIRDILFPQMVGRDVCSINDGFPRPSRYNFLRGVSKSLRDEVDRFHEACLLNHMRTDTSTVKRCVNLTDDDENIIEKYFIGEEESKRKCFFTRSLSLGLPTSKRQFDIFRDGIISFLEQVGDQIWYLHYYVYEDTFVENMKMSMGQIYIEFHKFLEYMPNLKWLTFELWMAPQKQKSVEKALRDVPPLKLQNLERIDLGSRTQNPEVIEIFEAVLNANSHIKILDLACLKVPISSTVIKSLPNLEVVKPWKPKGSRLGFHCLRRFLNQNWPLKRMELNTSAASLNLVFRFLEKFPTLEFLSLSLDDLAFPRQLFYLKLPNLTRLEMYATDNGDETCFRSAGGRFFLSLQFLLYAIKLKSMRWMIESANTKKLRENCERDMGPDNGIGFSGGWRDLSDSNIWDIFPDLEDLVVHFHKVDRTTQIPEVRYYVREYRRRTLVSTKLWPNISSYITKKDEHF